MDETGDSLREKELVEREIEKAKQSKKVVESVSKYEVYKSTSKDMTIRERHNLVHSLWKTHNMVDVSAVQSLDDDVVKFLFKTPYMPDRDYYEEVQPHMQLDDILNEYLTMIDIVQKHFGKQEGVNMLDIMRQKTKGMMIGNRFCRHPRQKIVNYN